MSPIRFDSNISGVGQGQPATKYTPDRGAFGDRLQTEIVKQDTVRLSAHAQKRLAERNVTLDEAGQTRLGEAVDRIREKGADKSLVLLDNLALVVSARNRVVITALDSADARDAVFTNIDSAVIV